MYLKENNMEEIKVKETNEVIYHEVLSNGLDIYLYPNKNVKNFFLSLGTKYGSTSTKFKRKDESDYHITPNGVAHFLEHITFHLDGKDADELFAPYGAYINAFTSYTRTCYVVECNRDFDKCLDNLLYYVYTPYYTEETVSNEKGIIKEESKRCDDDPNRKFWKARMNALFSKSNYKEKVVGELDEIDSISLDDINNAYNTFYHPGNMFLIITGNFDKDEAMKVINDRMNTFKFYDYKGIDVVIPDEEEKVNKEYVEIEENVLNDKISYLIKIPKKAIESTGLSDVEYSSYLDIILNSNLDATSDYYREILDKDIAPYASGIGTDLMDDYITIAISNSPKKGKAEEFIKLTEKYIKNLHIDEKVINRKIKCSISDYILSFDNSESVSSIIMSYLIYFNRYVDDYLSIIKNLTPDKGEKVLNTIDINNKSIVFMKAKSE
jgi:predicted Zn-dependent peptidase